MTHFLIFFKLSADFDILYPGKKSIEETWKEVENTIENVGS